MRTEPGQGRPLALITGASRGIGAELAQLLTDQQFDVWGTGRSMGPCKGRESTIHRWLRCDFADRIEVRRLIADLESYGRRIDLLIHNAAIVSTRLEPDSGLPEGFLVNAAAPVAITKALGAGGRVRFVVAVLAGTGLTPDGAIGATDGLGISGYFRSKELLMQAHGHLAREHSVDCWFYRPPATRTDLQEAMLDSLPLGRQPTVRRLLKWVNQRGMCEAVDAAKPLCRLVQAICAGTAPKSLSVLQAERAAVPAVLADARRMKQLCDLALTPIFAEGP